MIAVFHLLATTPFLNDSLTIVVMCPMMYGASSLNSDDGIGSLLLVFAAILLMIFSTSSSAISLKQSNLGGLFDEGLYFGWSFNSSQILLILAIKNDPNSSTSSSLSLLSGNGFCAVKPINPFTRLYSFLVSVPQSITFVLIVLTFSLLICCLYSDHALMNAIFVSSVLYLLQIFSLLLMNCSYSLTSSVNHGIDFLTVCCLV